MINVGSKSNTNNHDLDLGLSDKSNSKGQGDLFGNIFMAISLKEEDLGIKDLKIKNTNSGNNLSLDSPNLESENLDLFFTEKPQIQQKNKVLNNKVEFNSNFKDTTISNDENLNNLILNQKELINTPIKNQKELINTPIKNQNIKVVNLEKDKNIEGNNKSNFIEKNNFTNDKNIYGSGINKNELLNESLKSNIKVNLQKDYNTKSELNLLQKKIINNQNLSHKELENITPNFIDKKEINGKDFNNNNFEQLKVDSKNFNENTKVVTQDEIKIQFRQRNNNPDFININNNIKISGSSSEGFQNNNSNNNFNNSSHLSSLEKINDINEMLDLADERWTENLVNKLTKAKSEKLTELELSLSPKRLGKIKLLINIQDEKASVTIKTENIATSLIVTEQESKLNQMFEQYGMRLANFNSENFNNNQGQNNNHENNKHDLSNKEENNQENNKETDNNDNEETLLNIRV